MTDVSKELFENILMDKAADISADRSTDRGTDKSADFSPLALAYMGDTVYEVFIRTLVLSEGNIPPHKLHQKSIKYVKAKSQANILKKITECFPLTQDEQDIIRRGRNAKSGTIPKNADLIEYKYATAFESLIGYLYLNKYLERLMEILNISAKIIKDENKDK